MLDWPAEIRARVEAAVADDLIEKTAQALHSERHGDWPRWQTALNALPAVESGWSIENGVLCAGQPLADANALAETLQQLIPWRKGPLNLAGAAIDTEWRSDWKWQRIAPSIDLAGKRVLDIGAGNGYFGFQMLNAGARAVVACDPTLLFIAQYLAIRHFSGPVANLLLPLKFEALVGDQAFDNVFSMGVLYHRRDPLEHLHRIRTHLKPGGRLVLETLIIPGEMVAELNPPARYANMRNVHRLPTAARLNRWLADSGFSHIEWIDRTPTTPEEQRTTDWMPYHSLINALDDSRQNTIEGHPPPLRAMLIARRT
ncbi:MAG: tRNA 5-methoxyuridine(34)/uridine 5-oxyacetic acid(34) synthase CmoB [Symploca sp. SIO2G7]|nr:tRNA 5-methoxyuridine(34)/uridine 5-oxyacetic acid(34) synthase CmoB [Symploca sp. SIO2G7]